MGWWKKPHVVSETDDAVPDADEVGLLNGFKWSTGRRRCLGGPRIRGILGGGVDIDIVEDPKGGRGRKRDGREISSQVHNDRRTRPCNALMSLS